MNRRRRVLLWAGYLALGTGTLAGSQYGKGPRPASTNAPGEVSCQATKCHTQNELNSGDGSLTVSGVPASYEPRKRYDLTITLEQPGQKRWGFQLTALTADSLPAGDFLVTDELLTQLKTETMDNGSVRQYLEHTLKGSHMGKKDGPVSWQVGWTAPDKPAGPITFYTAANAANFNKKPWGDYIYTRVDTSLAAEAGPTSLKINGKDNE